ncbi:MAG: DegT/DnrJ/EryC1/StrS family aminotransferase [Melioribacteraceae bacterium]|nr:DegT/DnrJ/EryC1/StrS family aminotransferase [Melioribacteraceae bacterium]
MKVPFLDLKAQYQSIKEEVNPAIQNVLDNTAYIMGKPVNEFEEKFAKLHNVKYCFGLSSGTDGNHMVLWALGIGFGDEVILPANTFIATAWGATLCGATPVFADCEADSYNLDPKSVEAAITEKTKAIVAVHLYGQPANMAALKEVADRHNIYLVEDAAQAHLAEFNGQPVGSLSIATSFSFYPGKNLGAYGEAGAVVTNDEKLAEKFRMIREQGQSKKYYHEVFGHNYRMSGIQGAVLNVKVNHIAYWTNERRRCATKYNELLGDVAEIKLPKEMPYAKHVYHLFVIQVLEGTEKRDELQTFLGENDVASGLHYPVPLHMQNCFKNYGYKEGDFPETEKLASRGLSLPIFPELTDEMIEYTASVVKKFFSK